MLHQTKRYITFISSAPEELKKQYFMYSVIMAFFLKGSIYIYAVR